LLVMANPDYVLHKVVPTFRCTGSWIDAHGTISSLAKNEHHFNPCIAPIVQVHPAAVMTFLNQLFSIFDHLCDLHNVHKVNAAVFSIV
jgi:hypothetical protein